MAGPLSEIPQLCGCCDSAPGDPRQDPAAQAGTRSRTSRGAGAHGPTWEHASLTLSTCLESLPSAAPSPHPAGAPGSGRAAELWTTPAPQKPAAVPTTHSEEDTAAPAKPRSSPSSRRMARRGSPLTGAEPAHSRKRGPHDGEDSCLGVGEIQAPRRLGSCAGLPPAPLSRCPGAEQNRGAPAPRPHEHSDAHGAPGWPG